MKLLSPFVLRIAHGLTWVAMVLGALLLLVLAVAAYGLPGRWFQSTLDELIDPALGTLTVERISYLPIRGLSLKGMTFKSPEGELYTGLSRINFEIPLFSLQPFPERLKSVTIEDLYVFTPPYVEAKEEPYDFSTLELPHFKNVRLTLVRPHIMDITAQKLTATVTTEKQRLVVADISVQVSEKGEHAEGSVEVDFREEIVDVAVRGHLYPSRLNGIWKTLDLDIVRHYSDNFSLRAPAWGDAHIRVGLNCRDNIFDFDGTIVVLSGGDYCGVPFDEASTKLTSHQIYGTRTVFEDIKVYRGGEIAVEGGLTFDVALDTFEFEAQNTQLSPTECLQIIDEPFTAVIPEMTAVEPPRLTVKGALPLLTQQTPSRVFLEGKVVFPKGGTVHGVKVAYLESLLNMSNGTFSLRNTLAKFPTNQGEVTGNASFVIPPHAEYADISVAAHINNLSIPDVASSFSKSKNIPIAAVDGFVDLSCRTDESLKSSVQGDFNLLVEGEILTRAKLFSGLTDVMADYVPGISSITDVSSAKVNGSIDKGIVLIPDLEVTGDLLSVEGKIAYNIPLDTVSAELSVGNFKRGSVMGYLTRWATTPLNSLVWQIHVNGPRRDLEWTVHTFVGRIWDSTLGDDDRSLQEKTEPEPESEGGFFSWLGFGEDEEEPAPKKP